MECLEEPSAFDSRETSTGSWTRERPRSASLEARLDREIDVGREAGLEPYADGVTADQGVLDARGVEQSCEKAEGIHRPPYPR